MMCSSNTIASIWYSRSTVLLAVFTTFSHNVRVLPAPQGVSALPQHQLDAQQSHWVLTVPAVCTRRSGTLAHSTPAWVIPGVYPGLLLTSVTVSSGFPRPRFRTEDLLQLTEPSKGLAPSYCKWYTLGTATRLFCGVVLVFLIVGFLLLLLF